MADMTDERWGKLELFFCFGHDMPLVKVPRHVAMELFRYAQALRKENEKLRLEFEGVDCEHRANVMRELREENKQMRYLLERMSDSVESWSLSKMTIAELAERIDALGRSYRKTIPKQEQYDDSETNT